MHKQHNGFAMSGKEPLERHAKYVRVYCRLTSV